MRPEARKYLFDMGHAADLIVRFVKGKALDDFERDDLLRSGVERQFEIIGEALSSLARIDATCAERIPEYRRIIAFRNILIHGYAKIDPRVVWDVVQGKLPALQARVRELLEAKG